MYYLHKFCRLCLTFNENLNNMCNGNIIAKATACIGKEFDHNLPNLICNDCLKMLNLFFNFRNRCLRSEVLLNYYVEKLSDLKSAKGFKNTDLRVNIVNNNGISCIENDNVNRKVELCKSNNLQQLTVSTTVENADSKVSANSKPNCHLEETDVFLEEEGEEHVNTKLQETLTKLSVKRKSNTIEHPGKKLKTITSQTEKSGDVLNHSLKSTELIKLRKPQVQLNHKAFSVVTPPLQSNTDHKPSTNANDKNFILKNVNRSIEQVQQDDVFLKDSNKPTKSCIFTRNTQMPKEESQIATNTDLEKDITFHVITTQLPADNKLAEHKNNDLSLVPPVPNKTIIKPAEHKNNNLFSVPPVPNKTIIKPAEHKNNNLFSVPPVPNKMILKPAEHKNNNLFLVPLVPNKITINPAEHKCNNLFSVPPVPNKITVKPKIQVSKLNSLKATEPVILTKNGKKVKMQYVPILEPVNPKFILYSLLKNQKASSNNGSIPPSVVKKECTLLKGSSEKCLKTTINEHNHTTKGVTFANDKNASKNSGMQSYSVACTSKSFGETVYLKKTVEKYLVLKKINTTSSNKTDNSANTSQQVSVLKPTQTTTCVSSKSDQGMMVVPKEEIVLPYLPSDNFKSTSENHMDGIIKEETFDSDIFANNGGTFCNPFLKNLI